MGTNTRDRRQTTKFGSRRNRYRSFVPGSAFPRNTNFPLAASTATDSCFQNETVYSGTGASSYEKELPRKTAPLPGLGLSGQIALIRVVLGPQVVELAEILGVQRQTVYAWGREDNTPQRRHRERLLSLFRIANRWKEERNVSAEHLLHVPDTEGRTIFGRLCDEEIDEEAVYAALESLFEVTPRKVRETFLDRAAKKGMRIDKIPEQTAQFDVLTGRTDFSVEEEEG